MQENSVRRSLVTPAIRVVTVSSDPKDMTERETEWGLVALGRSGDVAVDVDEAISGPDRWELTVEFARWELRFEIPTPTIIKEFRDYLQSPRMGNSELLLGAIGTSSVTIVRDNCCDDRFFLIVSSIDGMIRFTLDDNDTHELISALTQAVDELDDGLQK